MVFVRFRSMALLLMLLVASDPARAELSTLFDPYQQLLSDYLQEKMLDGGGLVTAFDYRAALDARDTTSRLKSQRESLAQFDPASLEGQAESTAFWINAYNFFMIDQILTRQPDGKLVESVWDYGGRYNPFRDNIFQRELFDVGGRDYSLDGIEKGILLGQAYEEKGWKDARVHFAVNCASVGCPPLRRMIYTADNLESLLTENTHRALSTERQVRVEGESLYVSELFKWYEEDFREASGSVRAFIRQWAAQPVTRQVDGSGELNFIDYDWSLNKPSNFPELRRPEQPSDKASADIVLFSQPYCPGCEAAKHYFAEQKIPYREYDISASEAARETFENLGGRGTPFLLIDGKRMQGFSIPQFEHYANMPEHFGK